MPYRPTRSQGKTVMRLFAQLLRESSLDLEECERNIIYTTLARALSDSPNHFHLYMAALAVERNWRTDDDLPTDMAAFVRTHPPKFVDPPARIPWVRGPA